MTLGRWMQQGKAVKVTYLLTYLFLGGRDLPKVKIVNLFNISILSLLLKFDYG